jgi:hypothetical protein
VINCHELGVFTPKKHKARVRVEVKRFEEISARSAKKTAHVVRMPPRDEFAIASPPASFA